MTQHLRRRTSSLFATATVTVAAAALFLVTGCHKKPAQDPTVETSSAHVRPGVAVSDEIMKLCKIHIDNINNINHAPKFDFDNADLLPEDRDILEQVAKCVTTGPLKGRSLALVGRCDPRGEVEYNMVLGDYRAEAVHDYLAKLGVDPNNMAKTSRGELDAEGKDADGWRLDRRVDVTLKPVTSSIAQR